MAANLEVTEDELRSAYEEQKDRYMTTENRRIAHILVSTEDRTIEEAYVVLESIQTELGAGNAFEEVAKVSSDDSGSAAQGGDLGVATRGLFVPSFEEAAFALTEIGEISEVVETEFGLHLIKLNELAPSSTKAFEGGPRKKSSSSIETMRLKMSS